MPTAAVLNFHWHVPGEMATGGKPSRSEQLDWLREQGIRAIVSLEAIPETVVGEVRKAGLNYLYLPAADYEDVLHDPEAWGRFCRFIHANRAAGKPVFVHCSAGIRRSVRLVERYLATCERPGRAEYFEPSGD
jgi:protein tyrosine phosphatase (PTP) superfamily phosphohydrolase (DUF442 family)